MTDILRREIVRSIMGNLGLIPKKEFGLHGIATRDNKISKTLDVEFDEAKVLKYPVYAASLKVEPSMESMAEPKVMRAACAALEDDLLLVFGLDTLPLHGLRLDYYAALELNEDWGKFLIKQVASNKWETLSLYDQLLACAGMEGIAQSATNWKPCVDSDDLFAALTDLVEM